MRGEDRGLRRIGLGVKLRAQRVELACAVVDGRGELTPLGIDARARFGHGDLRAAHLEDFADREPGRGRDADQQIRIAGLAPRRRRGCGATVGRRRRGRGHAAFVARALREHRREFLDRRASRPGRWRARAPSRRAPTSSAMIAVTLRAFACRSPSWSLIADWKLFARLASTAAGRACRPVGFGMTMASEVIVAAPLGRRRGIRPPPSVTVNSASLPAVTKPLARSQRRHALAVGDDDLREQALRVRGEEIEIELDQRRAALHLVADLHARREALAFQRHRVDADVHQALPRPPPCAASPHGRRRAATSTSPSHGASSTASVGSIERPSPTIFCAKTGSGMRSSGQTWPESGAMTLSTATSCGFSFP